VEAIAKAGGQAAAWRADISDKARIDLVVAEVIGAGAAWTSSSTTPGWTGWAPS
jgi:hypothetical protein